jgi:EmrB/QacA subfamily drug resistance transporter
MAALDADARRRLTLVATVLGSSLAFIDATVVIVALPTIGEDLELGLAGQQWIFLSYSLALASLYLVGGAIGDRYGRRTTFMAATAAFALASVLAGAAPDGAVLIAARSLQGIAAAFMSTNSLALLRAVYGAEGGRAIGLWTAFTGVATILGAPAGGALVEFASWRWIFYINLPIALAAVAFAQVGRSPERVAIRAGCLDVSGAVLAAIGFGTLTYGLVEGADKGFASVSWAFAVAVAAFVAFVLVERRADDPMLRFDLFRRRNFAVANVESFLVYAVEYGALLFFIAYLQFLGFSPFEASLIVLPIGLVVAALSALFGSLADRHGPRLLMAAGPALMGVGLLLLTQIRERGDVWTAGVAGIAFFSVGLAAIVAPITATALRAAPERFAGIAAGINSTVTRMGSLFAVAVIGLVISLVFEQRTDRAGAEPLDRGQQAPALRDASIDAFRAGMVAAAAFAFAGAAVGALGVSNLQARDETAGDAADATTTALGT